MTTTLDDPHRDACVRAIPRALDGARRCIESHLDLDAIIDDLRRSLKGVYHPDHPAVINLFARVAAFDAVAEVMRELVADPEGPFLQKVGPLPPQPPRTVA
jgi:hypothetical protein